MLATIVNYIKTSPITSVVLFTISLGGSIIYLDERYAHATDLDKKTSTLSSELKVNRLTSEVGTLSIRRSMLEDKVFDQSVKPRASPSDEAILNRYKNELSDVNNQLKSKQMLLDRIQTTGKE